jgi:hypothetical protein
VFRWIQLSKYLDLVTDSPTAITCGFTDKIEDITAASRWLYAGSSEGGLMAPVWRALAVDGQVRVAEVLTLPNNIFRVGWPSGSGVLSAADLDGFDH